MLESHLLPTWNEIGIGFANHLWQSTVFMVAVGALTLLFRRNSAAVRYRLWMIASVKFLVPFSLLVGIGSQMAWRTIPPAINSGVPMVLRQIGQPFVVSTVPTLPPAEVMAERMSLYGYFLVGLWIIGAASVVWMWWIQWKRIARIVRSAEPFEAKKLSPGIRFLCSPAGMEPGAFGIIRPVLLLPKDITLNLSGSQFEAVVAHEMSHVRRHDNLAAAIHTIVEAVFWFHPLVWLLGARLVDERERACDEAVLHLGCAPSDYAEGILKICKSYTRVPACVAGVSGSNLKKRIEAIMAYRETNRLNLGKKLLLAFVGAGIFLGPILSGMTKAAEIQKAAARVTPAPVFEIASTVESSVESAVMPPAPVRATQLQAVPTNWPEDVSLIITDAERAAYARLRTDMERENFVANFWLQRDPTPGTPANEFKDEYYRRITYANEHFTTPSGVRGAQTDRGKMYILNGPPDEIISHPTGGTYYRPDKEGGGVTNTFPFETWRYRHLDNRAQGDNVIYEFVDKSMNGEYSLEYDPNAKDALTHAPGAKDK
jgi:GWxTD domain-containing protein